ncbi:MAG TPA: amino acid ABC transporter substrate-binding protein, partial [Proteobacteria bacterium]|nr:amino acid ABC transporter substrate-binding protein [Pseudomonadota bacterium]
MKVMTRTRVLIVALLLLSAIPAVARQPQGAARTKDAAIGCLLPLSGPKAAYGNEALAGALVAMGVFGPGGRGAGLKLIVEDTASDAKLAGYKVRRLVERGAVAIFGSLTASEAEAAAEAAQSARVPIILMNRGAELVKKGEFVFHNFIDPEAESRALFDFARASRGISRFGCLFPDNPYG